MANSSDTDSKTIKPSATTASGKLVYGNQQNVLNGYRSYNYIFTMAALPLESLKNPASYRDTELQFVVLKSGGKGTTAMSNAVTAITRQTTETVPVHGEGRQWTELRKKTTRDTTGSGLVNDFNKTSPGRFDMYIDNVEIDSLMSFKPEGSTSLATTMSFDIFEPHSINGFIEAIHVAGVAAGYVNYTQASFLLKMEFVGHSDSADLSTPVVNTVIPESTRYFIFKFTKLGVSVTQEGTRYKCSAIAWNEQGFGQPNVLTTPIQMTGTKVKDVLANFVSNLNAQIRESDNAKAPRDVTDHDEYDIKFLDWDNVEGFTDTEKNKLADSNIVDLNKENTVFGMADPSVTDKVNAYQTTHEGRSPVSIEGKPVIQFTSGARIHECIAAVLRDSSYTRTLLETLGKSPNNPDKFGMINYFLIKMEVINKGGTDAEYNKPYQKFTYVITPYKIHYTRIPGYASQIIDKAALDILILREYNYIYTGKNIDVLNFKLDFNTLFFEAIPRGLANNDQLAAKRAAGPSSSNIVTGTANDQTAIASNAIPTPVIRPDSRPTEVQADGGNGNQLLDSPYAVLAKNMHDAIINSHSHGMLSGELEIIGDPYYLVTGGNGNYNPRPKLGTPGITVDGEAAHNYSEVLVNINFNNPIDINSLEEGGLTAFSSIKVPYSGAYRVNSVHSMFSGGKFTQRLKIMRIFGQPGDDKTPVSRSSDKFTTTADPKDQPIPDTSRVAPDGFRLPATAIPRLATAPEPDLDTVFLDKIAKSGPAALANAFGVNSISQIGLLATTIQGFLKPAANPVFSSLTSLQNSVSGFQNLTSGIQSAVSQATSTVDAQISAARSTATSSVVKVASPLSNLLGKG